MKGTFVVRNAEGKYLCSSHGSMSYVWLWTSEFNDSVPGPMYYRNRRVAEKHIAASESPKTVSVGNSKMIRFDYPDMATAYAEAA